MYVSFLIKLIIFTWRVGSSSGRRRLVVSGCDSLRNPLDSLGNPWDSLSLSLSLYLRLSLGLRLGLCLKKN